MPERVPEDEQALLEAIVDAMIEATPESWGGVSLAVVVESSAGVDRMLHQISSPDGLNDRVEPTDELCDATRRIYLHAKRKAVPWTRATFQARRQPDGRWTFVSDFEYPAP